MNLIRYMRSEIKLFKLLPHLPEDNELIPLYVTCK